MKQDRQIKWLEAASGAAILAVLFLPPTYKVIVDFQTYCEQKQSQQGQWDFSIRLTDWLLFGVNCLQLCILRQQSRILRGQATSAHRIERAYINVRISENGITVSGPTSLGPNIATLDTLVLSVENSGKTPAAITRIFWTTDTHLVAKNIQDEAIVPPIDPRIIGGREMPPGIESSAGYPYQGERENMRLALLMEKKDGLENNTHCLWVRGFVRYRDVFDCHHIVGFCFAFSTIHNVFVARGDERYNYKREEQEAEIPTASLN